MIPIHRSSTRNRIAKGLSSSIPLTEKSLGLPPMLIGSSRQRGNRRGSEHGPGIPSILSVKAIEDDEGPLKSTHRRISSVGTFSSLPFLHRDPPPVSSLLRHYTVTVAITANYGHQTDITCSTIDILDQNNCPMKVTNVEFEPEPIHITPVDTLLDGKMVKLPDEPDWRVKWNGEKLSLIFNLASEFIPAAVRIWNARANDDSSIKSIQVYVNGQFVNAGEVPKGFGTVFSFKTETIIEGLTQKERNEQDWSKKKIAADQYGIVPVRPVSVIEIIIDEIYDEQSNFFSIGAVAIYQVSGRKVSLDTDVKSLNLDNGELVTNLDRLFRENPKIDVNNYLLVQRKPDETEKPKITIVLRKPMDILMCKVYNIGQNIFEKNYSVKRIRVLMNGIMVRIVTLRDPNKSIKGPLVDCYRIWCTESGELRNKIKKADQNETPIRTSASRDYYF